MCGIAGIMGPLAEFSKVKKMVDALSQRGPDDQGVWVDPAGGIVLGHTRLSIIDLSPSGHQPMTNVGERYWITFNGEIYNYKELRSDLEKENIRFTTNSDTEVILGAFECWGLNCLRRLRGMFAFVIWDRQKKQLYLVRDRMGIKPLLWAEVSGNIVFASEIKALLVSGLVTTVIEPRSMYDLFAYGSICQPCTILRGVQALMPSTCLIISPDGRRDQFHYWDIAKSAKVLRPEIARFSYEDNVHLLREKFEEACRYHLIADVPVGSFLSGGIDSASITALMSCFMTEKVKSFSIGFDNTREVKNEIKAANSAAKFIGCNHLDVVLTGQDISDAFDDLISTIDQPSYDGANTYFVSRAASLAGVKVTLSGLGGDELFAGYYHFSILQEAAKREEKWSDRAFSALQRLRPNRWSYISQLRCQPIVQRYAGLRRSLSDKTLNSSLSEALRADFRPGFIEPYLNPIIDKELDSISQTSVIECHHYLLNTLLRDADVMSMGHGLEVRPVMLDHKLVEYALALPPETKIRNGRNKAILLDAFQDLLPSSLLQLPKTGFALPLGKWLRTVLRERVLDCLSSQWIRKIFSQSFLSDRIHRLNDSSETQLLWTVLVLSSWVAKYGCDLPY